MIADARHGAKPPIFAAGFRPEPIRMLGIPTRRVNAVSDAADWNFRHRPSWKQRLED
jgi:hypothetical protein